jgi:hypothetical protein
MALRAIDVPPRLTSDVDTRLVLAIFAALAGAAAIWMVWTAVRTRDPLPVALVAGALVCSLNEPIYDLLGKIVYAGDHPVAFTSFDRHIPWFLVLGYVPWVGLLPLVVARMMASGVSRGRLHALAFASFVSVAAVESFGTSEHAWGYYGVSPLKYLGVAPQEAAVPIVGGLLLYAVGGHVSGSRRWLLAVIPTLVLPLVYASVSWPVYVGLHSDWPAAVNWLAGIAMLALTAGMVVTTTSLAQRWRAGGLALGAAPTVGPATELIVTRSVRSTGGARSVGSAT